MASAREVGADDQPWDHSQPLRGVIICCTSIAPDRRTELDKKIQQLGGAHKYDLTADITHIIVGQYDTPKYRHVAKERPDVKAMDARWIDVVTDLWMEDAEIDLPALEKQWQLRPLETNGPLTDDEDRGKLVCCITGFHDPSQRQSIVKTITENGGIYTPDLDRKVVTHLIVALPEGKKYNAARRWGIQTVSLSWLTQSVERGMILHEQYFDPTLSPDEQGKDAWVRAEERAAALGKRTRSVTELGQRKLRKTASMKLSSQRDTLWGDILGGHAKSRDEPHSSRTEVADDRVEVADSAMDLAANHPAQPTPDAGIFFRCSFAMAGFEKWQHDIIRNTVESLGGSTVDTVDALTTKGGADVEQRLYLLVPQSSQPSTHPPLPPSARQDISTVTEFFIERCLHNKALCDPGEHVLGRPFTRFPIQDFQDVAICTAGFTGIDLLHVEKCVRLMGARYATRLNESTSVLLTGSLHTTRKEKLRFALDTQIPIVKTDWLWTCVSTGSVVPLRDFMFAELRQDPSMVAKPKPKPKEEKRSTLARTVSEPVPPSAAKGARRVNSAFVDKTAFAGAGALPSLQEGDDTQRKGSDATRFETARTHLSDAFGSGTVPAPPANPVSVEEEPSRISPTNKSIGPSPPIVRSASPQPPNENPQDPAAGEDHPPTETKLDHEVYNAEQEKRVKERLEEQKAAERADLASKIMASKLNSLKDPSSGADTTARNTLDTSREDESTSRLSRRKKGIFGRAVSNVSAASTASHESSGPEKTTGDGLLRTRSDGALMDPIASGPGDDDGDSRLHPSTQISYQDAEGAQLKAQLMQRMLAGEQGGVAPPIASTSTLSSTRTARTARTTRKKGF